MIGPSVLDCDTAMLATE
eukprot:symbB.v1.2.033962.t1/scaffold4299.1/size41683/1